MLESSTPLCLCYEVVSQSLSCSILEIAEGTRQASHAATPCRDMKFGGVKFS